MLGRTKYGGAACQEGAAPPKLGMGSTPFLCCFFPSFFMILHRAFTLSFVVSFLPFFDNQMRHPKSST
jgi:hypothetical protein